MREAAQRRGLPTKSPQARTHPELFSLGTRADLARGMLDRPVTATFAEPTPLRTICERLQTIEGMEILFDRPALAACGKSDTSSWPSRCKTSRWRRR